MPHLNSLETPQTGRVALSIQATAVCPVQQDELVLSKAYLPLACMRPDVGTDVVRAKRVIAELHSRTYEDRALRC